MVLLSSFSCWQLGAASRTESSGQGRLIRWPLQGQHITSPRFQACFRWNGFARGDNAINRRNLSKVAWGRTENGICMCWSQDAKPAEQTSSCGLTEFELSDVESARDSCLEVGASWSSITESSHNGNCSTKLSWTCSKQARIADLHAQSCCGLSASWLSAEMCIAALTSRAKGCPFHIHHG